MYNLLSDTINIKSGIHYVLCRNFCQYVSGISFQAVVGIIACAYGCFVNFRRLAEIFAFQSGFHHLKTGFLSLPIGIIFLVGGNYFLCLNPYNKCFFLGFKPLQ